MELNVQESSAGGNTTLFVLSPVLKEERFRVAKKLLEMFPHIEQVGFVDSKGLTMAGEEFCGNASRAYAFYLAQKQGLNQKKSLTVSVSGTTKPLEALVDSKESFVSIEMPLPSFIKPYDWENIHGSLVAMEGILHLVLENHAPDLTLFHKIKTSILCQSTPHAFGVMFLENHHKKLTPIVHVPQLDATYVEGSCASGSLACACVLCKKEQETFTFVQPKGSLSCSIWKKETKILRATVEGTVFLSPTKNISL